MIPGTKSGKMLTNEMWQPLVVYHLKMNEYKEPEKRFRKKPSFEERQIPIPFHSDKIFTDKESAGLFMNKFIQDLILDGSIPKEVITEEKTIDDNLISTLVKKVLVAAIDSENLI